MTIRKIISLTALMALSLTTEAKISLPSLIADRMVVEQNSDVRLWGTSSQKNAKIKVKCSWSNEETTCKADRNGAWSLSVKTPNASFEKQTISISDADETVNVNDALIGEVWLASGQSNMEMPLRGFDNCPVDNSVETILQSDNYKDKVRMFTVQKEQSYELQTDCKGEWRNASAQYAAEFSATAYYFATILQSSLQVPVGIVECAYGGSRVESWMPREQLMQYPDIDLSETAMNKITAWERPLLMYNAMFLPVKNYTYKGIIWYQGESNVGSYKTFANRLTTMVDIWRTQLGLGDIPFYTVEIAPYGDYGECGPLLREQQHVAARQIKNSACISTNDLAKPYERFQIHPSNKRPVGLRLALTALNKTYGHYWMACDCPTYKSMSVEEGKAIVEFDNMQGGFSRQMDIQGFEVAGADHIFHAADTVSTKDKTTLIIASKQVAQPVAVRYCFHDFAVGNLANSFGLPITPFRTDNW